MNIKDILYYLLLPLLLLMPFSCRKSPTVPVNREHRVLVRTYADLLILRSHMSDTLPAYQDSVRFILEKHGMSGAAFQQHLAYFQQKPERWQTFFSEALRLVDSTGYPVRRFPVRD